MKRTLFNTSIIIAALICAFSSCKKKEQPIPEEQELVTTMKLVITDGGSFSQTFIYKIENGFGSTTAGTNQIDTVKLSPNKTYTVATELYNEKTSPVENITEEVLEERDVHLFLYKSTPESGAGSIAFSDGSKDHKNNPFNQTITFTTGSAGSGTLQVNLIHEPTNKSGTTLATSGGETDAEAIFPVRIQ